MRKINYFEEISADPENFQLIIDAYEYYEKLYEEQKEEISEEKIKGMRITDLSWKIAGMAETIHARWSEIKSISDHLEILTVAAVQKARKFYIEGYNRQLVAHQVNDFANADPAVLDLRKIHLRINLVQNKWEGVSKGLEKLHYQMRNTVELHKAGIDDIRI